MAVTNENSDQVDRLEAIPSKPVAAIDHGHLKYLFFEFTQGAAAGDAGSTAALVKLPPGKVRVFASLSRIYSSAMGTSRTMDIGHEAYTEQDGDAVAADSDDLDADVDVSSAVAFNIGGTLGTHETKVFDSREGIIVTAQVNDGTLPAAATISGYVVYGHI